MEKSVSYVEAEVQSIIEIFLINVSYSLENEFYDHLYFYVMRDLPSDHDSIKSKVMKIREI